MCSQFGSPYNGLQQKRFVVEDMLCGLIAYTPGTIGQCSTQRDTARERNSMYTAILATDFWTKIQSPAGKWWEGEAENSNHCQRPVQKAHSNTIVI